jgi:type VI secretion system secreted protein Hcp
MAYNMILELDGVKGESQDKDFPNMIDISSFSWGVSNPGSGHTGSGSGTGLANVNDLTVSKYTDASTNKLILYCYNGKHVGNGKLHVFKAGGDQKVEYLTYEMTEVFITNFSQSDSSGGSDLASESVTLNFSTVDIKYKLQQAGGTGGDNPHVKIDVKKRDAQV